MIKEWGSKGKHSSVLFIEFISNTYEVTTEFLRLNPHFHIDSHEFPPQNLTYPLEMTFHPEANYISSWEL